MYGYIYLTTNLVNGKKYIGQTKADTPKSYLGSGKIILRAIKKYGKKNFTKQILCKCESLEELCSKEIYYIAKYNAVKSKDFYNLHPGGSGNAHTEEAKKKISENHSGKKNPFYGRKHSKKTLKRMSEVKKGSQNTFYGKKHTEETKRKIANSRKGKCCGKDNPFYGKTHSKRVIQIIRESNVKYQTGRKQSKETIEKRRQTILRKKLKETR
jgi:group I intron endonuclease